MKIVIIVPCWNEEKRIAAVVASLKKYGQIVVVDDGSIDNSYELAKAQGATVLRHLINRGQGAALETGQAYARLHGAEIVVHFDADGQHQADEIPKLIKPLETGEAEVVLGSRFLDNENLVPFFKKWLILKPAIIFQNYLFKLKLTDAHNGFRAFSAKAVAKIKITQDGFAHASEIIELVRQHQLIYKELPVKVVYHESGQGFLTGLRIIRDLLVGRFNR